MTNPSLLRLIHVGARELGLDADTRHDLQMQAVGKASLRDMTEPELKKVLRVLEQKGFTPRPGRKGRKPAPRADIRFCHVMWRLLHEAGEARVAGAAGLNAFIRARFERTWGHVPLDIDQMREWEQIDDVVQALKQWCARAGIELEG